MSKCDCKKVVKLEHLWNAASDPGLFSIISQFKIYIITFKAKTFVNLYFYLSKDESRNPIYETALNYSLLSNNLLSNNTN